MNSNFTESEFRRFYKDGGGVKPYSPIGVNGLKIQTIKYYLCMMNKKDKLNWGFIVKKNY